MTDSRQGEPDWANSDQWTEFQWEQALKHSDHVAARYFRLLERFGDLPDAEDFIADRLGEQNFFEFQEEALYLYDEEDEWDGDEEENGDNDDDADDDDDAGEQHMGPGDSLYFESCPVYQRARQIALGWCNILSSVLKADDRLWGMAVLFHLGRVLSYLALSIGDGTFERLPASLAFAKRAMQEINLILGEIDRKTQTTGSYKTILKLIREHLLETHDMLVTLLFDLRKRQSQGSADEG